MLKKALFYVFVFSKLIAFAQKEDVNFTKKIDSLKQRDNLAEFIYVHLDKFAENPSAKQLSIFSNLLSELWRRPSSNNEKTAEVYLYVNYAYYLKKYGFINKSIRNYEKAYESYKKYKLHNFDIIEFCLKPLANNYTRLGDVDRAEDILKITIEKAQKQKNESQVISGYFNLAAAFRTKGNFEGAIKHLETALKRSKSTQFKAKILADIALNYLMLKAYDKAIKTVHKSSKFNRKKEKPITLTNAKTLGMCFMQKEETAKALQHLTKALKYAKEVFGNYDREVAKIYNLIANVYKKERKLDLALTYFQKAITTLLPNFIPKTIIENPSNNYFYPENTLKEALDGRASVFILKEDYEQALKNFELAFAVEEELRATYLTQNAKLVQQQENRDRSEKCIELCYYLFQKTGAKNWIEKGFNFSERSKAVVLREAKEYNAVNSSKTDQLFAVEKKLLFQKAQLNKRIVLEELKPKETINVVQLAALVEERNEVLHSLQLIKTQLSEKYPNLKLNIEEITVNQVKNQLLKTRETQLITYFDGKNEVFVFSISKEETIAMYKIIKDDVFTTALKQLLHLFSEERGTAIQNNVTAYTQLAFDLYNKLLPKKLKKNMIIVPDGLISFIPFDALIKKHTPITNFEKLPYLIKTHKISYAYSTAILLRNSQSRNSHKSEDKFIGFFPVFEGNHRGLTALKYTLKEAESIKKLMEGTFLISNKATKLAFTQEAANYQIIHLSTHATAGDYNTPPAIEFFDETLYLPEIYGYNLHADLLVLSACETGIGMVRKGEGAMSLARGFSYAGVKNLIVSLWKVNDKSTKTILTTFYKSYAKGSSKSQALHNSKLSYLKNTSISPQKKSPYYWAGFVYIGETTNQEQHTYFVFWILAVFALAIGSYLRLKKH